MLMDTDINFKFYQMGLFSTTHHHHNNTTVNKGPDKVEVHEHRAPTDESVKLLNEMHDKVLQNIMLSVKCNSNELNFKAFFVKDWRLSNAYDEQEWHLQFSINHKEYKLSGKLNYVTAREKYPHANQEVMMIRTVYDELIKKLAEIIILQSPDFRKIIDPHGHSL